MQIESNWITNKNCIFEHYQRFINIKYMRSKFYFLLIVSLTALSCSEKSVSSKKLNKQTKVKQIKPVASNKNSRTKKIVNFLSETSINKVDKATRLHIVENQRKLHACYLENSPFKITKELSKMERKALGIPPNKYFENEYELTMNPETGRPHPENLILIKRELEQKRREILQSDRTPGDATDNAWLERGPTNVGGRVRAVMFDPTDPTKKRVFAGGVSGGLWRNDDITSSNPWVRVNIPDNLAVTSLTYDPNNTSTFYLGTGESYTAGDFLSSGLWKSSNAGLSWTKVLGDNPSNSIYQSVANITVNLPSTIAGNYPCTVNEAFGLPITNSITSDIALVADASSSPSSLGCGSLVNGASLAGKIALVRRGNCTFLEKIQLAQNAGAIAVIIMNNTAGEPIAIGGTDTNGTVTIPSVMVSRSTGDLLEAALLNGNVNVTLNPPADGLAGVIVPGKNIINDVKVRNNNGVSEIYAAVGDGYYSSANQTTYLTGTDFGLFKSINGGVTWTEVILPLTVNGTKYCPMDIEFGSNGNIWISTTNSYAFADGGGTILLSTDGGATFVKKHEISGGRRTQITVSKSNGNKIYVLAAISGGVAMVKSSNAFTSFSSMTLPVDADTGIPANDFTRGQAFYDLLIDVDPNNDEVLYAGGIDLFKSTNGGTSWTQISKWSNNNNLASLNVSMIHADQHGMAFAHNNDSNLLLVGNDGGVYYSTDGGNSIFPVNTGLNITQFYTVAVAPTTGWTGDNFVAGAQDNGTQQILNASSGPDMSTQVQGGDGAYVFIDQQTTGTDRYRITNYVYNQSINFFNYATGTSRSINSESTSNGAFICPMALDSSLDILYADYSTGTTYQIRRYTNLKSGTVQKTLLTNALLNNIPTALTVSRYTTSSTTLFVGTRTGRLLKVVNANTTPSWSEITGYNFVGSISDVELGVNENELFVTMHNYNVVSVWYSNDGGVTWQNKEGNLPDLPVKCILKNPLNTEEVIIGTELGVWFTNNFTSSNPTWNQSYNGMSNVKVTDLDLRNDNRVFASTYGRGVFSGIFTAQPLLNNIDFTTKFNVTIYPNPVTDILNIETNTYVGNLLIDLIDLNGRLVQSNKISDFNEKYALTVSNLPKGIYILKLKGEQFVHTQKISIN